MGASKIEQLIEDIYTFIENCKSPAFMQSKVTVPKDELYDLLDELRFSTPDEIKRYQKIIANREAILADAKDKADHMVEEAKEKINVMVDESEMVQQAYQKAEEIVDYATQEANRILEKATLEAEQIRGSALVYTEDLLSDAEKVIKNAYSSTKSKYDLLMVSLKGNLEIIENNKKELNPNREEETKDRDSYDAVEEDYGKRNAKEDEAPGRRAQNAMDEAYGEAAPEDEYNFSGDTFLNNIE